MNNSVSELYHTAIEERAGKSTGVAYFFYDFLFYVCPYICISI